MNALIKKAITNRQLTFFTAALILLSGLMSYVSLPQNEDPEIKIRIVQIVAVWPGATPEDVEQFVTKPLERAVAKQPAVSKITTESITGVSILKVEISKYVTLPEVDDAFQQIRNYVGDARSSLPQDVVAIDVNDRFGDTTAYVLGLVDKSEHRSYRELEAIAERIRDRIKSVDGVVDFTLYGVQAEKIFIEGSATYLDKLELPVQSIFRAIQSRNSQVAQPTLNINGKEVLIEVSGPYENINEVRETVLSSSPDGKLLTISDIDAKVYRGYEDPQSQIVRVNGARAISMGFAMKRGRHIVRWGAKVDKALAEIQESLPADLELVITANQPRGVDNSIKGFMSNFMQAVGFVLLIMGIGMGWRNATVIAVAIPMIIAGTFTVMSLLGIELHQMSINALIIALGLVVDNAVVIVDNIRRYLNLDYEIEEAAFLGAKQMKGSLFGGTLTTIAAFCPLAFMPGDAGTYVKAIPQVVSITLVLSYLVAMFIIPSVCTLLVKPSAKKESTDKPSRFAKYYHKAIDLTQRFKKLSLLAVGFLLTLSIVASSFVPTSFFPPAGRSEFLIDVWLPEGYNLKSTDKKVAQLEKKLQSLEGVESFTSYIGFGGPRFHISVDAEPPKKYYSQIVVNCSDGRAAERVRLQMAKFGKENVTGCRVEAKEMTSGPPVEAPIVLRVSGTEVDELKRLSDQFEGILLATDGVTAARNNYGVNTDKLVLNLDQTKAAMLGVTTQDIANGFLAGFDGNTVSRFKAPERQIDMVVRLYSNERKSYDDIKAIQFESSVTGQPTRLDEFAQITLESQTSTIVRENEVRTLTIKAYVADRAVSEVLKDVQAKVAEVDLPLGYSITYGGEAEATGEAFADLASVAVFALAGLLLILSFQFESVRIGLAIYLTLPLAFIGAIFGLLVTQESLGFMAALGLISLAGIVVNNAIVMVEFVQENLREGKDLLESIKEAGVVRLPPILLTTASTVGGLVPLALFGGALFPPMSYVIIFGLLFGTVLTLLVMPLFYVVLGGAADSIRLVGLED